MKTASVVFSSYDAGVQTLTEGEYVGSKEMKSIFGLEVPEDSEDQIKHIAYHRDFVVRITFVHDEIVEIPMSRVICTTNIF